MQRHAGVLILALVVLFTAAASRSAKPVQPDNTMTCAGSGPCITWVNQSTGVAIRGRAVKGDGIVGVTFNPGFGSGAAGVVGADKSTDGGAANDGVLGEANAGVGVSASSAYYDALHGVALNGVAVNAFGKIGVFGQASEFPGVWGLSLPGTGVLAQGGGTDAGKFVHPALGVVTQTDTGDDIDACSISVAPCTTTNSVFRVDQAGNVYITGQIFTAGSCSSGCARRVGEPGRRIVSFAPRETAQTIEDFGEAQLVDGAARIIFEAKFAGVIDPSRPYLVFITPDGDTRGLYVAKKSATGFDVREVQGGRSTLAFDYRVLAHPIGASDQRLPIALVQGRIAGSDRFVRPPARPH